MPDEANDKRIKEAAEHYHPAYDDEAWEKMEHLLDQHLPLKRKRRKFIYFLLPLILVGGVLLFFVTEYNQKDSNQVRVTMTSSDKSAGQNSIPLPSNASGIINKDSSSGNPKAGQPVGDKDVVKKTDPNSGKNSNATSTTLLAQKSWQQNELKNVVQSAAEREDIKARHDHVNNSNPNVESKVIVEPLSSSSVVLNQNEKNSDDKETSKILVDKSDTTTKIRNEQLAGLKQKKEIKKTKNNFAERFGISVSAGPDLSGTRVDNPGKIALNMGLGVSYNISPSFTLRSGFFVSKKIYSVGPHDYKTTAGPGNYYYLDNIDANCLVYSIPINFDYNFKKEKNHNWFLSTGISSYLMKREAYEYYYKYPTGQAYTKDWTIHNQNQNFLSVLNLSGGYQYSFSNRISVMAEPYISLPLSGVGAGKVKLKSTGILFTFTVKPFLKKEK